MIGFVRGKLVVKAPPHKGMKITHAEFMALAGHLKAALESAGAKGPDVAAVMNFAASTHDAIVEVK